jgi:hypothetical protein
VHVELQLAALDVGLPDVELVVDVLDLAAEYLGNLIDPRQIFGFFLGEAIAKGLQLPILDEVPLLLERVHEVTDLLLLGCELRIRFQELGVQALVGILELLDHAGVDGCRELIEARLHLGLSGLELDTEVIRHGNLHRRNSV